LASSQYTIDIPDFSDKKVVHQIEQELVGNYITVDPMEPYLKIIRDLCIADPGEIEGLRPKDKFCIGGQVTLIKPIVVKKKGRNYGREMAFIVVQHNELDFDVTVFPDTWSSSRDLIRVGDPVVFEVERDSRGCHLLMPHRLDLVKEGKD